MNLLQKNAGKIDRIGRIILGVILLALTIVGPKTLFGLIGIVPLLTGLFGSCPIYTLLGINTCKFDK